MCLCETSAPRWLSCHCSVKHVPINPRSECEVCHCVRLFILACTLSVELKTLQGFQTFFPLCDWSALNCKSEKQQNCQQAPWKWKRLLGKCISYISHNKVKPFPYSWPAASNTRLFSLFPQWSSWTCFTRLYRLLFILGTTFIYTICVDTVQNAVRKEKKRNVFFEDVGEGRPDEWCWQSVFTYCTMYVLFISGWTKIH